jgi:hypothetical protein
VELPLVPLLPPPPVAKRTIAISRTPKAMARMSGSRLRGC